MELSRASPFRGRSFHFAAAIRGRSFHFAADIRRGRHFGETGYFRVRRGTDEISIESMAMAADIVLPA